MPRLAQDNAFELDLLHGQTVRELIACTESDDDQAIEMLFLRISDDGIWHRLFLNAGIGFWETWAEEEAFDGYEDIRRIDFAERWGLRGSTILTAECHGAESRLSEFRIGFSHGTLVFRYADPGDMNSDTIVGFEADANAGAGQDAVGRGLA